MSKRRINVGTSGWTYKHWDRAFYPHDMHNVDKLVYYSKHFNTVEINTTFYHFAKETTFKKWHNEVGEDFLFSVKINRRFTHVKRLIIDKETEVSLKFFFKSLQKLKNKCGVVLIQLPESAKRNDERLRIFLEKCNSISKRLKYKRRLAIEFRNEGWFSEEIYGILEEQNTALVIANSSKYPYRIRLTANFSYLRFHGPAKLFLGKYTNAQLRKWKRIIDSFPPKVKTVYCYFNNDAKANAIENAICMSKLII